MTELRVTAIYFDATRANNSRPGEWVVVVRHRNFADHHRFDSLADAEEFAARYPDARSLERRA